MMSIEEIRRCFPALVRTHLGHPVAYFDGPGGTQVPRAVVEAMNNYLDKRFENAIQLFQDIIDTDPDDHTAGIFMEKALKYLENGAPENWTGTEEMLNK